MIGEKQAQLARLGVHLLPGGLVIHQRKEAEDEDGSEGQHEYHSRLNAVKPDEFSSIQDAHAFSFFRCFRKL